MGKYLLPVLALGLFGLSVWHVVKANQVPPKPPPPVEPARTQFARTVAGAGITEALTENIAVGAALPGVVLEVYVPVEKVGQRVKAGEPLFRVDDRQLRAQLKVAMATQAAAEAQLAKLEAQPRPEELPPSEAKVRTAQANLAVLQDHFERARKLYPQQAMAEEDYRQRKLSAEVARQQLAQAQAEYELLKAGAWDPDKTIAAAAVEQARAQVAQIHTDLERALVRAPVDGDVLQVNVRQGEYVGTPPSQALLVLGNVHRLHVRVDVDEQDIPRFRPNAAARAALRGSPRTEYALKFVRIEPFVIPKRSLTGDTTERVDTRVLQVIYSLEGRDQVVYVGQQLDVFIDTNDDGGSAYTAR
jgi:multidrug resistance efflux pump